MMNRPLILGLVALGGIVAGVLGMTLVGETTPNAEGWAGQPTVTSPATGGAKITDDTAELGPVVESLIELLDQEISERHVLAEEMRDLKTEVEGLKRMLGSGSASPSGGAVAAARTRPPGRRTASREDRLLAAGFSERELESIERRAAQATMQQMALDDRARREGWINSPRYFEELGALESGDDSVRGYLGDEAYDRYLYATGRPNRLAVQSVIATSPAEQAGLRPGDVVLSYGDRRVFSTGQLIELRSSGAQGEPVAMQILRDGENIEITMPRGPIGIQTGHIVLDPSGENSD